MSITGMQSLNSKQGGFVTLVISLSFLVLLSIIVFYGVNTGIQKQRISANEIRSKEAKVASDSGQTDVVELLHSNVASLNTTWDANWSDCQLQNTPPCEWGQLDFSGNDCGDDTTPCYVYYSSNGGDITQEAGFDASPNLSAAYVVAKSEDGDVPIVGPNSMFHVVAEGTSADGTAVTRTQNAYVVRPVIGIDAAAPLIAASSASIQGSFEVIGNPDGGGENSSLSTWTSGSVAGTGSFTTCEIGGYLNSSGGAPVAVSTAAGCTVQRCDHGQPGASDQCDCSVLDEATGLLSYKDGSDFIYKHDIYDDDTSPGNPFDDLFAAFFGCTDTAEDDGACWNTIKDSATQLTSAECQTELDSSSQGMYWVSGGGTCTLQATADADGARTVGSPGNPVLIILEDTNVRITANSVLFGIIFMFDRDATVEEFDSAGTAYGYGSIISENQLKVSAGTFTLRYDECVLNNLIQGDSGGIAGKILGTYTTYTH